MVIKCAPNWKRLGKNLKINGDLLNITEKNYDKCEDCCSEMLSDWLESTPNSSWEILLNAVQETLKQVPDTVEGPECVVYKLINEGLDKCSKMLDMIAKADLDHAGAYFWYVEIHSKSVDNKIIPVNKLMFII